MLLRIDKYVELIIVLVAALSPMFLLASKLSDGDEFIKAGIGAGAATAVLSIYKIWKGSGTSPIP